MQQYKTRPFTKSLRGKMVLMMMLVSLIPLIIAGAIMYSSMTQTEDSANESVEESRSALKEDTVAATKASQAWNISVELETWMAAKIREVKSWAGNTSIIEAAKYSKGDTAGITARNAAQSFLGQKSLDDADVGDAYLVDSRYELLTQIPGGKSTINTAAARGAWGPGLYVSELQSGMGAGVSYPYFVDIAVLVEDLTQDTPLGVLVVSIKVHPSSLSRDYGAKVPDSSLVIWAPSNQAHKLIVDSESPNRYESDSFTWNDAEAYVLSKAEPGTDIIYPTIVRNVADPVAGYARAANNSDAAEIPFQFPEYDGLGWLVMVSQDAETALEPLASLDELEDELNSATTNMLITLIAVIVGLLVIVPIIAYYLSRGITGPIGHLRDAAEKVSMGDMSVVISVESDDEIGDLAQSFERMVMAVRFLSQEEEE